MHPIIRIALSATVLVTLFACGGGGGGGSTAVSGAALSGKVIDGPISGATVCLDVNSNNLCDTGEPTAITDATGNYKLPEYAAALDGLHILAIVPAGAIDLDTNTAVTTGYVLMAPASNPSAVEPFTRLVTPLTTLVSTQMLANPSLSAKEAEQVTLVSNNLGKQTTAILDVDVTTNTSLHKVAQAVVGAIAQTSSALVGNTTFTTAASSSNDGTTSSMALKQAMRLTQSILLQQMQNSDGAINSAYHSNGAVNTSAINTLATNTVNDSISYIAATTKAGKSTSIKMADALSDGIHTFKIAHGGYYLNASNVEESTGQSHYKVNSLTTTAGKNGQYRDINGVWRKSSSQNFDLISGTWVAEYGEIADTLTSVVNPPTISGNCFTSAQTSRGINLTACAVALDLTGKKLSDFNFDCKGPSGAVISGCNVNAVFPSGSVGYNFQVYYDEDQYQLSVPVNGNPIVADMTSFISDYSQPSGPYLFNVGGNLAMNIGSYDASTKTGTMNWYDNSSGTFSSSSADETTSFVMKIMNGVDVLTTNYPNLFYKLGGGSDQTAMFAYAPAGTNTGSQSGIYRGWKYSSNLATNMYFGMSEEQLMNSTAFNFVAAKYQLPALP